MNPKTDRGYVRTAADLERKYKLAELVGIKKAVQQSEQALTKTNATLENFMSETLSTIDTMQDKIDGNITTYFYSGVPTLSNMPASEWAESEYCTHLGSLYYDNDTGKAYRFAKQGETFLWIEIVDTDLAEALAIANAAQDTADNKRRVFLSTPIPPYDSGDLWLNNEEIYVCQVGKTINETYIEGDFIIATKYTDDTVANEVANELTVVKGQVTTIIEDQNEIKVTFTETANLVNDLTGEIADEIDKREAMIRATSEDGLPVVELGSTESPVKTKYKNDGMYIEENGVTTSYFKNGKAYNYDMEAINSLTIGNFSFKPRANGNLSLVYTGGDN